MMSLRVSVIPPFRMETIMSPDSALTAVKHKQTETETTLKAISLAITTSDILEPFQTSSISHFPPLTRSRQQQLSPQAQLVLWTLENGGKRLLDYEAGVFSLVNAHRATLSGVSSTKLIYDTGGALDYIALWKSMDMGANMYMQHDQPASDPPDAYHPSTISDRYYGNGYSVYAAWGENIAYGLQTPQDVMVAWLSDIGHRQNVEGPWSYIGICAVQAANGLIFCTQDFGTVHCPVGVIPPPQPVPVPVPPPPVPTQPIPDINQVWRKDTSGKLGKIIRITRTSAPLSNRMISWKGNGKTGAVVNQRGPTFVQHFTYVSG